MGSRGFLSGFGRRQKTVEITKWTSRYGKTHTCWILAYLQVYETVLTVNYALTLVPLQGSWLHVCLAISCINNRLSAVVNGQKIEDIQLPEAEGDVCPLSLFRRLILFKGFGSRGIWHQVRAKVTNLNIYSSQLPLESMKKKTSGEICGEQDGDYLSWSNSSWKLTGAATWTDIEVEDLCRTYGRRLGKN